MHLERFVPSMYVAQCLDVDDSYTIPEFMDACVPSIPDWFYTEQFFTNLLNKNPFLETGYDPDAEALKLFFSNEARCKILNNRFPQLLASAELGPIMFKVRAEVHRILGSAPRDLYPRCTTGATTKTRRGENVLTRFAKGAITARLQEFLLNFGPPDPRWLGAESAEIINYVSGDTVLKTAKISRLIGKENCHNMYWQCGLADCIVKRLLLRTGINMSTAQETHRRVAHEASITGLYTTDDLVSGSHFLYNSLMRFLLPHHWLQWCDATRAEAIRFGDNVFSLEHYMPNGNGFCAALQTVVFYSVIKVCTELECAAPLPIYVYGDDLLYDTKITKRVRWLMQNIGFITNVEKSFSTGHFRESCGGDYLNGHFVRPFYAKTACETSQEKTTLANTIRARYGEKPPYHIRRFWLLLVRSIPVAERLWGPPAMGHDCLHPYKPHFIQRRVGKWRTKVYCWTRLRKKSRTFKQIAYGNLPSSAVIRILSSGHMAGWGQHAVLKRKVAKFGSHALQLRAWRLQTGAIKSPADDRCPLAGSISSGRLTLEPSVERFARNVPKSFTFYESYVDYAPVYSDSDEDTYVPKLRDYYEKTNGIDEMDPLSIFDKLRELSITSGRIINCAPSNYNLWSERKLAKQRFLLLSSLKRRSHMLQTMADAYSGVWGDIPITSFV